MNPAWHFARAVLGYCLSGKLRLPHGHLPPSGHVVPQDFAGICVATAEDAAVDDYVIARLLELGVRHVRLDFTYGDNENHVARFLQALIAQSLQISLHMIQPFSEARKMATDETAGLVWQTFVTTTLDRFGSQLHQVEVGSTINRKRWAGYTLQGFLNAWDIAFKAARSRNLKLAGPSITDFEPIYNIGILALLKSRGQLPDILTDNLFSERSTEPERYDHKILGHFLAPLIKYNLIKKARLLKKITADFGVGQLESPAAFWTLPRIARVLPDVEEKQADYLSRYLVLCAASGALQRASWGPLICHREGLIDDGEHPYPALERITHYASVTSTPAEFRTRPAFTAFKAFTQTIPGLRYLGPLSTNSGLEIHAFQEVDRVTHAAWTINGKAAALADIYRRDDLATVQCISRDGEILAAAPDLISETPIYLCWARSSPVELRAIPMLIDRLAIHRHIEGKSQYLFNDGAWQGMILAANVQEAETLRAGLHPSNIGEPPRVALLRKARNAVWKIADPRNPGQQLVIKQPLKMHLHKKYLDRLKPSKAKRSWNGANELLRRGIETARPIAYFEKMGDTTLTRNYFICEYVAADFSARDLLSAFARGEREYQGISDTEAYRQLCDYILAMHGRGVFFRDLSGGNILIKKSTGNVLSFSLIDTNRARFFNHGLAISKRISDLTRICNKLHWAGREIFMGMYLSALGKKFSWRYRLPFYSYDMKVDLKRKIGRKAIKKLFSSNN
ncbi:MAG: lipopolysaccharide kinase InaA family protein [Candidatus Methylopumilus sp.]|jgi:hypothetical protein